MHLKLTVTNDEEIKQAVIDIIKAVSKNEIKTILKEVAEEVSEEIAKGNLRYMNSRISDIIYSEQRSMQREIIREVSDKLITEHDFVNEIVQILVKRVYGLDTEKPKEKVKCVKIPPENPNPWAAGGKVQSILESMAPE